MKKDDKKLVAKKSEKRLAEKSIGEESIAEDEKGETEAETQEIKAILVGNAREYYKNASEAKRRREYNTAVTLFFKTISALADIYILEKIGSMPSSHSERFRILETKYHEIYSIIDKDFPFYQDSYRAKLNLETCEMLEEDAKKLFEILKLDI